MIVENQMHSEHSGLEHGVLMGLRGAAIATASITLAPFLMRYMSSFGEFAYQSTLSICGSGAASGMAGSMASVVGNIPLIGTYLASGGIVNGLVSVGIGLGGVLAARALEKKQHPTVAKIVRWVAISTSILVALPAILPALGMGFHFISTMSEPGSWLQEGSLKLFEVLGKLGENGAAGAASAAAGAGGSLLASAGHLLSCGLAAGSTLVVANAAKAGPSTHIFSGSQSYAEKLYAGIPAQAMRA